MLPRGVHLFRSPSWRFAGERTIEFDHPVKNVLFVG